MESILMSVNTTTVLNFLNKYGYIVVFVIVIMEYLNLPGLPAGVVFPTVGIWVRMADKSFFIALGLSIIAGVIGSMVLYIVGRLVGEKVLHFKNEKIRNKLLLYLGKMEKNARITIFTSKLLPVVRTLIGLPAGVLKINVWEYILYSALGIAIWNSVLLSSGYFLSKIF